MYIFIYLFSLLPISFLYVFGDAVYLLVYYVMRYRRDVVRQNLEIAFPDKTDAERKQITKAFYRNFIDSFIETIKMFSAGKAFIQKRFAIDPTVIDELIKKYNRCQVHLGHNFNWEVGNLALPLYLHHLVIAVYMPIKNKTFDKLFINLRQRTGSVFLPATEMKSAFLPYREKQYILGLVADQVPGDVNNAYWLNFFNKPTPFVRGPEKGARAGNIPVIFGHITKIKRGYYKAHLTIAAEEPRQLPEGELTRKYIKFLESVIREHPDMWLWSHRRWKKEWKEEYRPLWIGDS